MVVDGDQNFFFWTPSKCQTITPLFQNSLFFRRKKKLVNERPTNKYILMLLQTSTTTGKLDASSSSPSPSPSSRGSSRTNLAPHRPHGRSTRRAAVRANPFWGTNFTREEDRRKNNCVVVPTSKLGLEVLQTLKNEGYIGEFERVEDKRGGKFKINLLAKITKCGAITPRFKVKKDEYNTWEQQFLPSYNRGMLLVTTNQGVMSHHEAANKGLGGFLIGYVY